MGETAGETLDGRGSGVGALVVASSETCFFFSFFFKSDASGDAGQLYILYYAYTCIYTYAQRERKRERKNIESIHLYLYTIFIYINCAGETAGETLDGRDIVM